MNSKLDKVFSKIDEYMKSQEKRMETAFKPFNKEFDKVHKALDSHNKRLDEALKPFNRDRSKIDKFLDLHNKRLDEALKRSVKIQAMLDEVMSKSQDTMINERSQYVPRSVVEKSRGWGDYVMFLIYDAHRRRN